MSESDPTSVEVTLPGLELSGDFIGAYVARLDAAADQKADEAATMALINLHQDHMLERYQRETIPKYRGIWAETMSHLRSKPFDVVANFTDPDPINSLPEDQNFPKPLWSFSMIDDRGGTKVKLITNLSLEADHITDDYTEACKILSRRLPTNQLPKTIFGVQVRGKGIDSDQALIAVHRKISDFKLDRMEIYPFARLNAVVFAQALGYETEPEKLFDVAVHPSDVKDTCIPSGFYHDENLGVFEADLKDLQKLTNNSDLRLDQDGIRAILEFKLKNHDEMMSDMYGKLNYVNEIIRRSF